MKPSCCDHYKVQCCQGRKCPVRQACLLPLDPPRSWASRLGIDTWWLHMRRLGWRWAQHDMGVSHPEYPRTVNALRDIDRELARLDRPSSLSNTKAIQ